MEIETHHVTPDGHKDRKRARIASEAHVLCEASSFKPAVGVLPDEVLFEIVRRLPLADLAATATSGEPLASAARAALARKLEHALNVAGVSDVDNDPTGAVAVLYNAIGHDDAVTLKAILGAGLIRAVDDPLPPMATMATWETPIVFVFYLHNSDTIECADSTHRIRRHYEASRLYDTADDVSMVPYGHTWRELSHTPLVRAIRCGARRCVRTLLAVGARPHPSPEALLGVALARIFLTHVAIAELHRHNRSSDDHVWLPCSDRYTDRAGIVEDLTAAFARTPPPLPLLDANPLSMLRYGANMSIGRGSREEDLPRVLNAILSAGYSPDEPVSRLPPPDTSSHGLLWLAAIAPSATYGARHRPIQPRDEINPTRKAFITTTERQAADIRFSDMLGMGVDHSERLIAYAMLRLYERVAPNLTT